MRTSVSEGFFTQARNTLKTMEKNKNLFFLGRLIGKP
jgi:hypothetical protein